MIGIQVSHCHIKYVFIPDDYILKFKGSYSISDSEKDQKSRITIKNNNLDSDLKGKAKFENKYLTFGNKDTCKFLRRTIG